MTHLFPASQSEVALQYPPFLQIFNGADGIVVGNTVGDIELEGLIVGKTDAGTEVVGHKVGAEDEGFAL